MGIAVDGWTAGVEAKFPAIADDHFLILSTLGVVEINACGEWIVRNYLPEGYLAWVKGDDLAIFLPYLGWANEVSKEVAKAALWIVRADTYPLPHLVGGG
jgi:hypothetical protein